MVNLDDLVEAHVTSVVISTLQSSAKVLVSDSHGSGWLITADGIDDLWISDVSLSNIIDRVFLVERPHKITPEIKERILWLMKRDSPRTEDLEWPPLKVKTDALALGELCFLEIEPVYGAFALILAKKITIEKLTP
jgi:hypothetical protein